MYEERELRLINLKALQWDLGFHHSPQTTQKGLPFSLTGFLNISSIQVRER